MNKLLAIFNSPIDMDSLITAVVIATLLSAVLLMLISNPLFTLSFFGTVYDTAKVVSYYWK